MATIVLSLCVVLTGSYLTGCQAQRREGLMQYSIYEEVPVGTEVGNIIKDSDLNSVYPDSVLGELNFTFLAKPRANFSVGAGGRLYTSGRLDREVVCSGREHCDIPLDIAIQPVKYFQIVKAVVSISDVNDNQPAFLETQLSLSILESASVESTYVLPTARDNDSPEFSIQTYTLLPESVRNKFALRQSVKLDGSLDLRLVLKKRLDREVREHFNLQVVATDGGPSPMSGTLDITLRVIDSNDNEPHFDRSSYEVTIPENVPENYMVVQVHASDADDGINGQIEYSFSAQTKVMYGERFRINAESGEISVVGEIDHETTPIYHMVVTARDLGPDALPVDVTVIVHVQDVNDNAPEIDINTLGTSHINQANVAEHSPVPTFVAYVTVRDRDDGDNGRVNCTLDDLRNFSLLQRFPMRYEISTAKQFDRERKSLYYVTMTCRDHGEPVRSMLQTTEVNVTDINDNPPVFSSDIYTSSLLENNFIGAPVLQVNATDRDVGKNAQRRYSLSGGDVLNNFAISPGGRITALTSFDRENKTRFSFHVWARDLGTPSFNASAQVIVSIDDVNDNAPEFKQESFSFSIEENKATGSRVGVVVASDRDAPPLDTFRFALFGNNDDVFNVASDTGVITTARPLDRERQHVYYLLTRVTDAHPPGYSATAEIIIYIRDKNDNAPLFTFPSAGGPPASAHISNKVPPGYVVANITAQDPDIGVNGRVRYELAADTNPDNFFMINQRNGTITVIRQMTDVKRAVYNLSVLARDYGVPSMSATANYTVIVDQDTPYHSSVSGSDSLNLGQNFILIIALSCACAFVIAILTMAIVCIRKKDRNKRAQKYNCRMEALRMLTAKETMCASEEGSPCKSSNHTHQNKPGGSRMYEQIPVEDPSGGHLISPVRSPRQSPAHTQYHEPKVRLQPFVLTHKHMEVHQMLHTWPEENVADVDVVSLHSGDDSNTDSGRGPSEDGEKAHRIQCLNAAAAAAAAAAGGQGVPPAARPASGFQSSSSLPRHVVSPSGLSRPSPSAQASCSTAVSSTVKEPSYTLPRPAVRSTPSSHSYSNTPSKLQSFKINSPTSPSSAGFPCSNLSEASPKYPTHHSLSPDNGPQSFSSPERNQHPVSCNTYPAQPTMSAIETTFSENTDPIWKKMSDHDSNIGNPDSSTRCSKQLSRDIKCESGDKLCSPAQPNGATNVNHSRTSSLPKVPPQHATAHCKTPATYGVTV